MIAAMAACTSSNACAMTGRELLQMMHSEDPGVRTTAAAYVKGISDANDFFIETYRILPSGRRVPGRLFCKPETVPLEQAVEAVREELIRNPGAGGADAAVVVERALANTWPCARPAQPPAL